MVDATFLTVLAVVFLYGKNAAFSGSVLIFMSLVALLLRTISVGAKVMNQSQTSRFRSSNFYRDVIKHLIKEIIAEAYSLLITLKSPKLSKSENEVLSELKRSGIAKVDGFLSPETCDALAQDLKALLDRDCGVFGKTSMDQIVVYFIWSSVLKKRY